MASTKAPGISRLGIGLGSRVNFHELPQYFDPQALLARLKQILSFVGGHPWYYEGIVRLSRTPPRTPARKSFPVNVQLSNFVTDDPYGRAQIPCRRGKVAMTTLEGINDDITFEQARAFLQ